jgi:hypothetical protein
LPQPALPIALEQVLQRPGDHVAVRASGILRHAADAEDRLLERALRRRVARGQVVTRQETRHGPVFRAVGLHSGEVAIPGQSRVVHVGDLHARLGSI